MARTTGSSPYAFRHRPIDFDPRLGQNLGGAHSKFAPDDERDGGDGSTWFTLKGLGLLRLNPGLTGIDIVGGDAALAESNIHGATVLRHQGETFLALPSDESEVLWIADLDGRIVRTFPNPYGDGGAPFSVCDVAYVDGLLFATNGYADNVCFTCDPFGTTAGTDSIGAWERFRFGGEGTEHGRFGTAHGITRIPGTSVLTVADRSNSRLESFTPEGRYIGGWTLPPGALPCSVDYHDRLALVACLEGPGGATPAPIYLFEDGNLVSEINIGRDLEIDGFTHIHHAAFRVMEGPGHSQKLFVLAYAWEPGNLAILEAVS